MIFDQSKRSRIARRWLIRLLATLCLAGPSMMLVRGCNSARDTLRRAECKSSLHAIARGLHNYHDVFESFPPAHTDNERGWPRHTWRVLNLPYVAEYLNTGVPYDRYRFDEAWNSPTNAGLARPMPHIYRCPSDEREGFGGLEWTSCLAIIGDRTCWPGDGSVSIREITDGTSNTLLVVESHNSGIHWMEPRDLHVGQMATTINPPGGQGISSFHKGGAHVILADGSLQYISEKTDPEVLRRLIERDDGEEIGEF